MLSQVFAETRHHTLFLRSTINRPKFLLEFQTGIFVYFFPEVDCLSVVIQSNGELISDVTVFSCLFIVFRPLHSQRCVRCWITGEKKRRKHETFHNRLQARKEHISITRLMRRSDKNAQRLQQILITVIIIKFYSSFCETIVSMYGY